MPIPHGRVSSIALARILEKRGVERRVAKEVARAVGGHHGVFDTASVLQQASASPQAVGEGLWEESRTWIIDWLTKQHDLSGLPTKHELAGLTLLAGLTTVSDWIASSEEHFAYRPEPLGPEDLDSLLSASKHNAGEALDRLGWRTRLRLPDPLDFQKFFGISNPRPLQVENILISAELTLPSLVIVEAPMGEGKTEAALFVAERQKQRHQLRGSFIALPTSNLQSDLRPRS
jgi:CRISPR-associated endonuclease/helicase Cas3